MYKLLLIFLFSTFVLFSYTTFAETNQPNNEEALIGKPGDPSEVSRTIKLTLLDNMFLPPELIVSKGETIRFVLNNLGNNTHQFLFGSADDLKKAAKMRQKNKNLIRINPAEQKELIWQFGNAGTVNFACPIKDHFNTMRGRIIVE
ncbi:MAG: cupredoxin domain-containing protein [Nitrosomonas sp.]|nr:cupredoxin domain-containing protein [Nitrosomonas sp.]